MRSATLSEPDGTRPAAVGKLLRETTWTRFDSASAFAAALQDPGYRTAVGVDADASVKTGSRRASALMGTGLVLASVFAAWGWLRPTAGGSGAVRMIPIALPNLPAVQSAPSIPPSGDHLVFQANGRLWVQRLDALSVRELPGTEGGVNPFWSPDSRWISFFNRRTVLKVPLDAGDPVTITTMPLECAPPSCGGSWTGDGHVLVSSGAGAVLRAPEGGGTAEVLIEPEPAEHFHVATWLPGGAVVVVVDPDEAPGRLE
ncbi:MAG TPA: hypothetical protein EYQ27_00010 [Gemmatimonadetes bacterium]|nr:hypothetical protein [Gemmatimonadota bacterium]